MSYDERFEGFEGLDNLTTEQKEKVDLYIEIGMPHMKRVQENRLDGDHGIGWYSIIEWALSEEEGLQKDYEAQAEEMEKYHAQDKENYD